MKLYLTINKVIVILENHIIKYLVKNINLNNLEETAGQRTGKNEIK